MRTKVQPKKVATKTAKAKPARKKKAASKKKGAKKPSALDMAAKLLADKKESMTTRAMVDTMAAQGLWTSPGGKTPDRTLYSAILREIATKGKESRFKKTDRGMFALVG